MYSCIFLHVVYCSTIGFDASMAHIMERISLFSATPLLRAILTYGFVIPANRITSEAPLVAGSPIAGEVLMPEWVHSQDFMEGEPVVDLGVILRASSNVDSAVDHDAQTEGANAFAADMLIGSEHLENIGEFEFLTSFLSLLFFCDCVIALSLHRLGCCHMKRCLSCIFGCYVLEETLFSMDLVDSWEIPFL